MPAKLSLGGTMAIVILLETSDGKTTELALLDRTVFGRSSKSDVQIEDSKLSGKHFSLELTNDGKVLFKDLESTNGSFLDHIKLTHHLVKIGDKIRVGSSFIYIDEKRLTNNEKILLKSVSSAQVAKSVDLPDQPSPKNKTQFTVNQNNSKKGRKFSKEVTVSSKDKLLEQEESSGQTQFLKLDISKKPKK